MAVKKPLVMGSDGRPQQLQAGDSVGVFETGQIALTAGATLIAGNPVYSSAAGACNKARANASGTKDVIGLTTAGIASAASGTVQVNGVLSLTTAEWDAVTGQSGGLTSGGRYFLSPATAGNLTTTVTTSVGEYVAEVGIALSTTELEINIRSPILL